MFTHQYRDDVTLIYNDIERVWRSINELCILNEMGVTGLRHELEELGCMLIELDAELETSENFGLLPSWYGPRDWEFPFSDLYDALRAYY